VLDLVHEQALPLRRNRRSREDAQPQLHEIFVVEADPQEPELLSDHLSEGGFMVTPVPDGRSCLELVATRIPTAIVLDMELPLGPGIDVLRSLRAWQCPSPVVIVARRADMRMAVEAMKSGAVDVFEKPTELDSLLACLRNTVRNAPPMKAAKPAKLGVFPGRELLTRREREVLAQVAAGSSNKEAGRVLNISPRTVEVHRARIMEKLNARNAADLVRIVLSQD
jgi:two-component system, LuxR family, response regulator FixJ